MKVLIIDDEVHVYKAMKLLLAWPDFGIGELLYAGNGEQGLQMVSEYRPEIIFTDMEMPLMDGIEFLQQLRGAGYDNEVIVVSGFNNYEYMKAAITGCSVDYILKPIRREELRLAVERAISNLKEKRLAKETSKSHAVHIITEYLKGERGYGGEVGDAFEKLGAERIATYIGIYLVKEPQLLDHFAMTHQNISFSQCFGTDEYIRIVLAQNGHDFPFDFTFAIKSLERRLSCRGIHNLSVYSKQPFEIEDIAQTAKKLLLSLERLTIHKAESAQDRKSKTDSFHEHHIIGAKHMLKTSALNKDRRALTELAALIASGIREKTLTLAELGRYTSEVNLLLKEMVAESVDSEDNAPAQISPWIYDLDIWEKEVAHAFVSLADYRFGESASITAVYDFLSEHYTEEISMQDLSEMFCMSPQYLSKKFKNRYGMTVGDAIRDMRIRQAQRYLSATEMTVNEISGRVGFEDSNYFIKVFKTVTGMTPSQARTKL